MSNSAESKTARNYQTLRSRSDKETDKETDQETTKLLNDFLKSNDMSDLKRLFIIRNILFYIAMITKVAASISLSCLTLINIITDTICSSNGKSLYYIIFLSIFLISVGLNYSITSIDKSLKQQQGEILSKYGININVYFDQNSVEFDYTKSSEIINNAANL